MMTMLKFTDIMNGETTVDDFQKVSEKYLKSICKYQILFKSIWIQIPNTFTFSKSIWIQIPNTQKSICKYHYKYKYHILYKQLWKIFISFVKFGCKASPQWLFPYTHPLHHQNLPTHYGSVWGVLVSNLGNTQICFPILCRTLLIVYLILY